MAVRREGPPLLYVSRAVLLVGVILVVLAAFGIDFPHVNLFPLGVAVCFAAGLMP